MARISKEAQLHYKQIASRLMGFTVDEVSAALDEICGDDKAAREYIVCEIFAIQRDISARKGKARVDAARIYAPRVQGKMQTKGNTTVVILNNNVRTFTSAAEALYTFVLESFLKGKAALATRTETRDKLAEDRRAVRFFVPTKAEQILPQKKEVYICFSADVV
jgi:hypothetical protein